MNIEFKESGIQCDNPDCDYTNSEVTYKIQHEYIDKPCPKCGQNLLTQEDHDRYMNLIATINLINTSLSPDDFEKIFNNSPEDQKIEFIDQFNVKIHTHKEIKIELDDQDN